MKRYVPVASVTTAIPGPLTLSARDSWAEDIFAVTVAPTRAPPWESFTTPCDRASLLLSGGRERQGQRREQHDEQLLH